MTTPRDRTREPAGPDVGPPTPAGRRGAWREQAPIVAAVAAGGAAGAAARYGVLLLWPAAPGSFPWATLAVNTVGCAAIGLLMVVVDEARTAHRLVRPFLGTGVLGGFTTFSTYAVDAQQLVETGHARTALVQVTVTVTAALAAVWAAAGATRRVISRRRT